LNINFNLYQRKQMIELRPVDSHQAEPEKPTPRGGKMKIKRALMGLCCTNQYEDGMAPVPGGLMPRLPTVRFEDGRSG